MVFGSTVLEVILGMVFVYLLLSLLCSAIGEYIEAKWNNRAKLLRKGIELLLNETTRQGDDLAAKLYAHGLIRPLYRDAAKLPSYIPSRTFAMALWNMATSGAADGGVTNDLTVIRATVAKLPNEELRTALLTLIDEANGDLARARANVEQWYESAMDRVSGWYKRRAAITMLVLGCVMAAAINADTITLAAALTRDGALRSAVVRAAEQRVADADEAGGEDGAPAGAAGQPENAPAQAGTGQQADEARLQQREDAAREAVRQAYTEVKELGLPIGWVWPTSTNENDLRRVPDTFGGWLLKLVGILLTGFAVSQGAPFWFDLLNKVMVVRSTVKPKEKSAEQPSKDRPAPRPQSEAQGEDAANEK